VRLLIKSLKGLAVVLLSGAAGSFIAALLSIESHNWTPVIILAVLTVAWWLVMSLIADLDPLDEY
jgi:hypothetical protein